MSQERMWTVEGCLEILSAGSRHNFCPSFCPEWFGEKREYYGWIDYKLKNCCNKSRLSWWIIICGSVTQHPEGIGHGLCSLCLLPTAARCRFPWVAPPSPTLLPTVQNMEAHRRRSGSISQFRRAKVCHFRGHSRRLDRYIHADIWRGSSLQQRTDRLLNLLETDCV